MTKTLIMLLALVMPVTTFAGGTTTPKTQAVSKLRLFVSDNTGKIIVRKHHETGTVYGMGSPIQIAAVEVANMTTSKKMYGIIIFLRAGEVATYIDLDEAESLIGSIDYMSNVEASSSKLEGIEASYTTRDGLEVSTYSDRKKNIKAAITFETVFSGLTLDKLADIKGYLVQAKNKSDEIQVSE